jgi:hypothetical protein
MSDTFVPLTAATGSSVGGASFQMKVLPHAETKPVFTPLPGAGTGNAVSQPCGRPVLTLQRQGDVVSGIRVECGCGQVIELKCVY